MTVFTTYSSGAWSFPQQDWAPGTKVAIYRGSFDPLHEGHRAVVEACLQKVAYIFIFPVFVLGEKERSPLPWRTQMCQKVAATYGDRVQVFTFDNSLEHEGISAVDRVRQCMLAWMQGVKSKEGKIYKIFGADALDKNLGATHPKAALCDGYLVAHREGHPHDTAILLSCRERGFEVEELQLQIGAVSSTWIRAQIKSGGDPSGLLPEAIRRDVLAAPHYRDERV